MSYTQLDPTRRAESPDSHYLAPINGDTSVGFSVPIIINVASERAPKRTYVDLKLALCICVTLSVGAFVLYKLGMLTNSE